MYCANCGTQLNDNAKFCSGCGRNVDSHGTGAHASADPAIAGDDPVASSTADDFFYVSPVQTNPPRQHSHQVAYAGFWIRALAYLIDALVILGGMFIISVPLGYYYAATTPYGGMNNGLKLLIRLLGLIYLIGMEASAKQATLGKLVCGLQVIDENGERIDLERSIWRNLAKILSGMILMIGFIMAAFTDKKRALHDMMATTYVIHKPRRQRNA